MKRIYSAFFLLGGFAFLVLAGPVNAFAENTIYSATSFSQLDFDKEARIAKTKKRKRQKKQQKTQISEVVDPAELLKQGVIATPGQKMTPSKVIQIIAGGQNTSVEKNSRAKLSSKPFAKSIPAKLVTRPYRTGATENDSFLIPRLRGPYTDVENSARITTSNYWQPTTDDACHKPVDKKNVCKKALALKELLRRFTGDNSFYEAQCGEVCDPLTEIPRLYGLTVKDTLGGAFEMSSSDGQCHYQLSRDEEASWKMIEGSVATCLCLPKDPRLACR